VDQDVPGDLETSDRYVLLPHLDSEGVLEEWYRYEAEATGRALREWREENGLRLK
jgi:hypothetical protein